MAVGRSETLYTLHIALQYINMLNVTCTTRNIANTDENLKAEGKGVALCKHNVQSNLLPTPGASCCQ